MLEIAGGILIAVAVIVLAPIWIPLALFLLIVGLFVGLIYLWPPLLIIVLMCASYWYDHHKTGRPLFAALRLRLRKQR